MEADNFIKESNSAPFTEVPSEDFIDILLQGGGLADEAAYYLLHHRFGHRLKRRFEVYHNRLMDNYEDVVEDFFFYLREGKECENQSPYQSLRRIRKKGAFEGWLLNTFRNYLTSRAAAEEKYVSPGLLADCVTSTDAPDNLLTDERALSAAAHLIAYAHQTLNPYYRFVLFRALLTMLDPQQSLPNEAVAQVLGMTGLSYRVTVHRAKCSLAKLRHAAECRGHPGASPAIPREHRLHIPRTGCRLHRPTQRHGLLEQAEPMDDLKRSIVFFLVPQPSLKGTRLVKADFLTGCVLELNCASYQGHLLG